MEPLAASLLHAKLSAPQCQSRSLCLRGTSKKFLYGEGLCKKIRPEGMRMFAQGLRVPPTHTGEQWVVEEAEKKGGDSEGSSYQESLFNSVNILMGVGLLSIPYALNEGGWASMGVLGLVWLCTNYTGKILVKCQEVNRMRATQEVESTTVLDANSTGEEVETTIEGTDIVPSKQENTGMVGKVLGSYEDIGEAAFGSRGRQIITSILYAELIGTCALFFILEGDHIHMLLEQLMPLKSLPSTEELMVLSAGVILPTTWLKDLSALSYIGAFGVLSSFGLTGVVLYEFFHHGLKIADTVAMHSHTIPSAFGLIAFVFAGHAVFPSIYGSMKEKGKYEQMLDTTYCIVGALCIVMGKDQYVCSVQKHFKLFLDVYCAIGVAGYCLYGSNTLEEVTLNIPPGALNILATMLILVSPITKFALTLQPVARGIESHLGIDMNGSDSTLARVNRTGLGLGTLFLATQVPYFGQVMSILGSFLTITVSILFPSMCYLKLFGEDLDQKEKYMNYVVLAVGAVCAVSGTWTAVDELLSQIN